MTTAFTTISPTRAPSECVCAESRCQGVKMFQDRCHVYAAQGLPTRAYLTCIPEEKVEDSYVHKVQWSYRPRGNCSAGYTATFCTHVGCSSRYIMGFFKLPQSYFQFVGKGEDSSSRGQSAIKNGKCEFICPTGICELYINCIRCKPPRITDILVTM